jgi:uncharacterized protein
MNPEEIAHIERLAPRNAELRQLWEEHRQLEQELERLRGQRFLTPGEEQRQRQLRKIKLAGRDRIQAILRAHRAE